VLSRPDCAIDDVAQLLRWLNRLRSEAALTAFERVFTTLAHEKSLEHKDTNRHVLVDLFERMDSVCATLFVSLAEALEELPGRSLAQTEAFYDRLYAPFADRAQAIALLVHKSEQLAQLAAANVCRNVLGLKVAVNPG